MRATPDQSEQARHPRRRPGDQQHIDFVRSPQWVETTPDDGEGSQALLREIEQAPVVAARRKTGTRSRQLLAPEEYRLMLPLDEACHADIPREIANSDGSRAVWSLILMIPIIRDLSSRIPSSCHNCILPVAHVGSSVLVGASEDLFFYGCGPGSSPRFTRHFTLRPARYTQRDQFTVESAEENCYVSLRSRCFQYVSFRTRALRIRLRERDERSVVGHARAVIHADSA